MQKPRTPRVVPPRGWASGFERYLPGLWGYLPEFGIYLPRLGGYLPEFGGGGRRNNAQNELSEELLEYLMAKAGKWSK